MNTLLRFLFLNPKKSSLLFVLLALACLLSIWTSPLALGLLFVSYKHFKRKPLEKDESLLNSSDEALVRKVQKGMGPPPKNAKKLHEFERLYKQKLGILFLQQRIQKAVFKK